MKFRVKVEVYGFDVVFLTNKSVAEKLTGLSGCGYDYCHSVDGCNTIYVLCHNEKLSLTPTYLSCVSHELNHASMRILEAVGFQLDYNNQEPLCYLQDFLMKKVLEKLWKEVIDG